MLEQPTSCWRAVCALKQNSPRPGQTSLENRAGLCVEVGFEVLKGKEASNQRGDEKTSGFSRHSFHEPCPRAFKNSADGSSFLSCRLQNLPRSLTRALLPEQDESWLFPSGQHVQGRPERSRGQWATDSRTLPGHSHGCHTTAFLPQQPVALGWGGGNCCLGSAPSYSLNLLLTSQPIFGCCPWSRHCFPTAPFQKELKEMSSVGFFLVCAKTIS